MGGTQYGHDAMNDTARRLRAQKVFSTDPAYLERMAREVEARGLNSINDVLAEGAHAFARCVADVRRPSEAVLQTGTQP